MIDEQSLSQLLAERPYLFSDATVKVSRGDTLHMAQLIAAVERMVALPAYRERVFGRAPEIARFTPPNRGVFFGYDFHLTPDGPKLIEINTNAGGGLLAASQLDAPDRDDVEKAFVAMFRVECPNLKSLAIVDESPASQYLYPEFLLFRELFARHGIKAVICDPGDLMLCHGGLWHEDLRIDLVYKRLTDFALAAPGSAALRQAYLDASVVVTPNPCAHALYADKRNLTLLADDALLAEWGVDAETRAVLRFVVPRTELVTADRADEFWARRKHLFFKPATGYGSKAAYRGDKITKRVFDEVTASNYVAQELVSPSTVETEVGGQVTSLKADIRCYAYAGQIQLIAARLWQGQTTNFRTPGGGFAKVIVT